MQEFNNPNYLPSLGSLAHRIFFCLSVPVSVNFGRLVASLWQFYSNKLQEAYVNSVAN